MYAPKCLTPSETHSLLAYFDRPETSTFKQRKQVRDKCIALLMLDTGCRRQEICDLLYRHAYWHGQVRELLEIEDTRAKYGQGGLIPISPALWNALNTYRGEFHALSEPDTPLFYSDRNGDRRPLSPRQVERVITQAAKRSIGRHVYPHMLRHTFGNNLRKVTDVDTASKLLRHRHLSSTQVYFHSNQDDMQQAIRRLHGGNGGNGPCPS
jgi:integrase/recombinase XerC